ncbi:MAG: type II 3-dehydroquinate dehydratase [Cyanobacteria bacterium P01_H01_bin.121]
MALSILVLHGPNLNLLGTREPGIYGSATLADVNAMLQSEAELLDIRVTIFQSNHEGELLDRIHDARSLFQGIVINAGAYTHTSVALRDALAGVDIPAVEVHLSNLYQREPFRQHSYLAPVVIGQISGFGPDSYRLGLHAIVQRLKSAAQTSELA